MQNAQKSTPRDFFFYILMTAALYASVVSVIALMFQYVNYNFPDLIGEANNYYDWQYSFERITDTVRKFAAILIVVWPVFIFASWLIAKDIKHDPEKKEIRIRKWLLYLTLFLSSVTIIADLITVIYNFFGGELSVRFYLKVAFVLVTALVVFLYFFWDIKGSESALFKKFSARKVYAYASSIAVLAIVIAGFFIIGSPARQRTLKFDERRVVDLENMQWRVIEYWKAKKVLPKTLDELKDTVSGYAPPPDPETGAPYEYSVKHLGELKGGVWAVRPKFELCATFKLESPKIKESAAYKTAYKTAPVVSEPYAYVPSVPSNWKHTAGRNCFEREIDPEIYQPYAEQRPLKID